MRKRNFLYTLALATPVLMGAGVLDSELTVDKLPACKSDEYLIFRSGGLSCGTITSSTSIQPPDCTGKLLTIRKNGDVSSLSCVDKGTSGGSIDLTKLTNLESSVTTLGTLVNEVKNGPRGAAAVYQGPTTDKQIGNILKGGDDNALVSAAKLCAAQYGAGAHMCTPHDVYESVLAGKLSSANNLTEKLWVYAARGNNPIAGSSSALQGLGENCGSYTYPTGDKNWSGTAITTGTITETGRWGVRFHTGSEAPCNTNGNYKIACCK